MTASFQLIDVNKTRYRKHLNVIIVGFIAVFALLAVGFGSVLIAIFSEPGANNFKLNVIGVVIALAVCAAILAKLKHHDYFTEVYYIWQLKQIQNRIFRKLTVIKKGAEQGQSNAISVLYFYYLSLQKIYLLDDNTITITKVNKELAAIENLATVNNVSLSENVTFNEQAFSEITK